ncbi:MAG: diguanylate cyclase [Pseudomonadota bacterium]|nr:diguanylate cyclase [Pseudomonadota bacterium]
MFFPFVKDIASKEVISIPINKTIGEAIQVMIESNHRAIVILDGHFHHILLAQDILTLNEGELDLNQPISSTIIHKLPHIHQEKNILEAIHYLQESVEYIATIDDNGDLAGLLSHSDLINSTDPEILMDNYSIGDIIKSQKNDIWVKNTDSTSSVILKMKETDKDCATIIEKGVPVGIFTIKDVLALYSEHKDFSQPISNVMTTPVETLNAKASIKEAIVFIKAKPFKRILVINSENKLLGMMMQKELISLAYNNWSSIMKQHQEELFELNNMLSEQADRYRHLAAFDPLTELYNRYKFIELYTTESVAMQQRNHAMSVIMIDIDFFKKINDEHGHNIGDDVLKVTANTLKKPIRNVDIVCRWGGEEFVILLPTVDSEQAMIIAEKLRLAIEEEAYPNQLHVTASLGVAEVRNNDGLEELISRADYALYQAKKQGRNKTVLYAE